MQLQNKFALLVLTVGAAIGAISFPTRAAERWTNKTPYYEDDAWYDVSEWLDGNDYNPTDEKFGRWDDEIYDSDSHDYDYDNDVQYWYADNTGTNTNNSWFYDYWNPPYTFYSGSGPNYDYAYAYYDYDGDGDYDSYTSYHDWDNDGWFEDVNHYTFDTWTDNTNSRGQSGKKFASNNKASSQPERKSSKAQQVTGNVQRTKQVSVRGIPHLVAEVAPQKGEPIAVDLGPKAKSRDIDVSKGDAITARGPITKAGDKPILLAQAVTIGGEKQHQIDRQARSFNGTLVDTHQTRVGGRQHTFVVLKTNAGKQRLVDLGRSDRLQELDLRKNTKISVRGVPFKIKDRPLVMAQSATVAGTTVTIDRRPDHKSS